MKNRFFYGLLAFLLPLLSVQSALSQTRGAVVYSRIFTPAEAAVVEYYSDAKGAIAFSLERVLEPEKLMLGIKDWRNPSVPEKLPTAVLKRISKGNADRNYEYGQLEFGRLPEGVYVVRARQGKSESRALMLVSRLGLVTKRSEAEALTWTVDSLTGQPRTAKVYAVTTGKLAAAQTADKDGLLRWKLEAKVERLYLAQFGNSWALSEADIASWNARQTLGYVYSERPVYRPGDSLFVKGILRDGKTLQPRAKAGLTVRVYDQEQNTEVYKGKVTTNEYGSFALETSLSARARTGQYAVQVSPEDAAKNGPPFFGLFKVEAYQKPEFAVTVTMPAKAVQGDRVTARINAEYLFGGKVANARVKYSVQRQQVYDFWWYANQEDRQEQQAEQQLEAYQNGYNNDWYRWYQPPAETIVSESGRLNAQGQLELPIPISKTEKQPYQPSYQYIVTASVEDETRQVVTGSASLSAQPASLSVSLQSKGYGYTVGDTVELSLQTRDLEDKGSPANVKLEVVRNTWDSEKEVRALTTKLEAKTDAAGRGTARFKLSKSGYYQITATVQDAKGRAAQGQWYIWVSGDANEVWYYRFDELSIKLDKTRYAPGDLVTALVQNPHPGTPVLVTLEAAGLDDVKILTGRAPVLRYQFKATAAQTPNVFVTASMLYGGRVLNSQKRVLIDDPKRKLGLKIIAPKAKFGAGEATSLQLKTVDSSGAGVPAEVSVAVVDEGVYLVQPDTVPDIAAFFHRPRGNVVGTSFSQNWYFQGVPRPLAQAAPTASANLADAAKPAERRADATSNEPRVRQDFRDVALWRAQVLTDGSGSATLDLKFPDNLTTWRVTAKGMTKSGSAGEIRKPLLVTQDVVARLGVPRTLVRGDTSQVSLVMNNNLSEATDATLELRPTGLTANGDTTLKTKVAAGGRGTLRVTLNADTIGTAKLQGRALTGTASDALEIPITVKARGFTERKAFTSDTRSGAQRLTIPTDASLETTRFTVLVTPSLTAAVSPALEYLVGYPYGCSEQTMSRFLPALLASKTLGANELSAETVKKLPEYVKIGVDRLESFQHADGGWGFWTYDESTLEMTAYVMGGLLRAKALDANISGGVLERGLKFLATAAGQDRWSRGDRAAAYLTLSIGGQAPLPEMRRFAGKDGLEASTLARMAIAFSRDKQPQDATDALDRLKALRQENPRGVSWRNPDDSRYPYWWSWDDNPVTTTAVALEAFARVEPRSPLIPKISAWLLAERQGARWVSTRDTAAVIEAALSLNEDTNLKPTPVTVLLNGEPVQELTVKGQVTLQLMNTQAPLKTGQNTLELKSERRILYSADLEYVREPAQLVGENKGIAVSRSYEKLTAKFDEKNGTYSFVPSPLLRGGSLQTVTVGEYLLVTLTVTAQSARYLLVSDAIPAGFKALETRTLPLEGRGYRFFWEWTWDYWFSGLDIRDDRVEVYADRLNGKQTIQYLLRAETPGKYTALPTESFLMYEPTVSGRSSGATLTVRDRGQ